MSVAAHLVRIRFVLLGAVLFLASARVAQGAGEHASRDAILPTTIVPEDRASAQTYAQDVAFLLDSFEEKAGALLKSKNIDWSAVRAEFTTAVGKVASDAGHVKLCSHLVARLQDGHATLLDLKVKLPEEPPQFGVGLTLCEVGEKVYVKTSTGPALASGVQAGAQVQKIDGKSAAEWLDEATRVLREERGFSTAHAARYTACHWALVGPEGRSFALELENAKGRKKINLACSSSASEARMVGASFLPKDMTSIGRRDAFGKLPSGFGYVQLGECAGDLPSELDTIFQKLGPLPGLVLDLRANNGGGTDHEEVFGRFLKPGETWKQYKALGSSYFAGPMVVIVDAGTRSTGETVSGMLKEDGRAYMIGASPTAGMSAQKTEVKVPSGMFSVRFAVGSNKARFNGGKGIEGLGVPPNEIVSWDPKLLAAGVDPQIARAEELLKKGFPKGKVEYKPHAPGEK